MKVLHGVYPSFNLIAHFNGEGRVADWMWVIL